jgi:hypothetical protein
MRRRFGEPKYRKKDNPYAHKPDYRGEFTNSKRFTRKNAVHKNYPRVVHYRPSKNPAYSNHERALQQKAERERRKILRTERHP